MKTKNAGFIEKNGMNFSVIGDDGKPIRINAYNFPSVKDVGVAKMAWHVAHYIMLGGFADDASEKVRNEVKLTIGDRG